MSIMTRRKFLIVVSTTSAGILAGCRPEGEAPPPTVYKGGDAPTKVMTTGEIVNADPRYGTITYDQLMLTDNQSFYTQTFPGAKVPEYADVNAEWKLVIDGEVANPKTYTYEDLRMMPEHTEIRTLQCIGNPVGGRLIGTAEWSGVLLAGLLNEVGVKASAYRAKFYAADGYETAVDVEWITQEGAFLAYKMNGQILPRAHGYPLRIFMPGLYGQKQPKWIERIEFIQDDFQGYWESKGWSDVADVQTNSIIRSPLNQTNIAGQVAIQGVANAGKRKITTVEVRVEDGDWMPATLLQQESPLVWTQWYILWTPPGAGTYTVEVRATDETGFTQSNPSEGTFASAKPDGTDAIHDIVVKVV
jgi:DMSO/TMAO reductase YedYZ molybdopterin-dependent catalytic subunit